MLLPSGCELSYDRAAGVIVVGSSTAAVRSSPFEGGGKIVFANPTAKKPTADYEYDLSYQTFRPTKSVEQLIREEIRRQLKQGLID
jgi:hypothetical protein